jgi:hypothetical protein
MGAADEIKKLAALRDAGDISSEEFETAKTKILGGQAQPGAVNVAAPTRNLTIRQIRRQQASRASRIWSRFLLSMLAVVIVFFVGLVVFALKGSSSPSATFTVVTTRVLPLDGNTVRVFMRWDNVGKVSGSDACAMDTNVHDQFGDLVNTEVNSVGTNGDVGPDAVQVMYQDIGVNGGDAQYIKLGDITFSGC